MSLKIIPFYAGILGLLFFYLTARVVAGRRSFKVGLGHGGHDALERRIAVHLNFVEYVPLLLLLLAFLEMNLAPAPLLHGLGILLVIGRILHGYGVSQAKEDFRFRMVGTLLTFAVLLISSLFLIYITGAWLLATG